MKRLILLFLFSIPVFLFSQKSIDIGLLGGGSYYLGEINTSFQFKATHPGGGAFYRKNYNSRYSLRVSLFAGTLSGDDLASNYEYQKQRLHSFNTPFAEIIGQFEFNFLPYLISSDKYTYSPYVAVGVGFTIASYASNPYQVVIPMGVGFKFNITKRLGAGLEYNFRKTFTDGLDKLIGVENPVVSGGVKQYAYDHDNDWYSDFGIFISYKLIPNGGVCYTYEY